MESTSNHKLVVGSNIANGGAAEPTTKNSTEKPTGAVVISRGKIDEFRTEAHRGRQCQKAQMHDIKHVG